MYKCTSCDYVTTVKLGKCPDCGSFGSFALVPGAEKQQKKSRSAIVLQGVSAGKKSTDTHIHGSERSAIAHFYPCKDVAYHRVFSGGIKQGGVYLLGGEPGIGKSTLILQILDQLPISPEPLSYAYFSGEEQENEIVRRAERIGIKNIDATTSIYHSTSLEDILATAQDMIDTTGLHVLVVDSIQTISSHTHEGVAGSPAQIKVCADILISFARRNNVTLFCLGHVTKGGEIAGPKYLEHIVDVVCYMDGDRFGNYRTLRTTKNRFGGTDDAIVFAMTKTGLQVVGNDFRLHDDNQPREGRVLTVGLENGRPILVHVEALLTKNYNNHPQRNSLGVDPKRLQLIIAILEKYCKCRLYQFDIFVNIPGEFVFYDSGIDIAIAAAIYSQYKNIQPDPSLVYIGEIALSGQLVKPKAYEKRVGIVDGGLSLVEIQGFHVQQILE